MSSRLDISNGVKRIEQPSGLSPVVIFKYKASPTIPLTLDENEGKVHYIFINYVCLLWCGFSLARLSKKQ